MIMLENTAAYPDIEELRARTSDALNQMSARLMTRVELQDDETQQLQKAVGRLGQLAAGLAIVDHDSLPAQGAGYGSTVVVENMKTGAREQYTLMVGTLVDIDAQQVSLASPIGQALLGRTPGEEVLIDTPQRPVWLRVVAVTTLLDILEGDGLIQAAV